MKANGRLTVPKLRFPGFSGEWQQKFFYDLLENVLDFRGRTPLKLGMNWGGNIPSLSALNVKMGYIDFSLDPHKGSEALYEKWMTKGDLQRGDILFTMEAPLGNVALVPDERKYILSQRVVALQTKSEVDSVFLARLMSADKFQLVVTNLSTGSTAKGINQRSLEKVKVCVPQQDEQRKIAGFLTLVDKRVKTGEKKLELLKKYKQGVMQKIFTQQIRFKDEAGNDYPDWNEKPLGEITLRVTARNGQVTGRKVLTNSAMQGIVVQGDFFEKDIANSENLVSYHVVDTDDFVYNPRISSLAPVGPIRRNHLAEGVMSPLYSVFRFKDGSVDFFETYFLTDLWHDYIRSVANSGARHDRMNLTTKDFYSMPLPFPSLEEQQKIADFLSDLDDKIKLEESKLERAKLFKESLLQQMFI